MQTRRARSSFIQLVDFPALRGPESLPDPDFLHFCTFSFCRGHQALVGVGVLDQVGLQTLLSTLLSYSFLVSSLLK